MNFSARTNLKDATKNKAVSVSSVSARGGPFTVHTSGGTIHEIKSSVDVYYHGGDSAVTATSDCPVLRAGDPPMFMPAKEYWAFLRVSVDGTAWISTIQQA